MKFLKFSILFFIVISFFGACKTSSKSTYSKEKKYTAYLFSYFTSNRKADESIHFAISMDGLHFTALNNNQPIISSEKISLTGGVRDPHILRGDDGETFYMVVTDMVAANGWDSNRGMVLLKSKDLVNWTSSTVHIPTAFKEFEKINRVWAPQTIYDPIEKKYMVYFSMREGTEPDKIYYSYANKEFTALETVPKQLFFKPDKGASIDGDIIYKDGKYHLFFKTEGSGAGIKVAVSDKLTEGYRLIDKYVQQTRDQVEGSGVFKLNDGSGYILMYDVYTKGKYQFTKTTDFENFKIIDSDIIMNFHPRHGTVMPITTKEAERLIKKWLNPQDVILSYQSRQVKRNNIVFDTANKKLYLPLLAGSSLKNFDPQFAKFPGVTITTSNSDFSKGEVKYKVTIPGKPAETFTVQALENNNPVLNGYYADPYILYSNKTGQFYLYPTSDGFVDWAGNYFKVFSSSDLVQWKDEGVILDLPKDVKWAKKNAWAPTIIEKKVNGQYKYFYYYTAAQKIGVAVADTPTGPFTDSGAPIIATKPNGIKGGQEIDPDVFQDPVSGKTYLYRGNGYLAGIELNDDMISTKPETLTIMTPDRTFREGAHVLYRNGVYYIIWSENDTRSPDYRVRYGMTRSPLGKVVIPENNIVLQRNDTLGIYGTGHHSTIKIPSRDEWYIVYHRFTYPNGINMGNNAGFHRETCIDKMEFNTDGTIKQIVPTHRGIAPVKL